MTAKTTVPGVIPIEQIETALRLSLGNGHSLRAKEGSGLRIVDKFNSWLSRGRLDAATTLITQDEWAGCRLITYWVGDRETCFDVAPYLPSRTAQLVGVVPFALPTLALVLFLRPHGWLSQMSWPFGLLVTSLTVMGLVYAATYLRYLKCWRLVKRVEMAVASPNSLNVATQTPDATKTCPSCGARYRPSDYSTAAAIWYCSACRNPLPKA